NDTEIELAIDTDLSLTESRIFALIAKPRGTIGAAGVTVDLQDHKLLDNGKPLQAAYCVFSIRSRHDNPEWGNIPSLRESYDDFVRAVRSGKHQEAEEALAGFNRQVIICPHLISADKNVLREKAMEDLREAFPGGGQAARPETIRQRFESRQLADLN